MKAVCVKPDRSLEIRDVPAPTNPPAGHVVVEMEAAAVMHGDHSFLRMPKLPGIAENLHDTWGASGAGRVIAIGADVPAAYAGKRVAIYRSLSSIRSKETIGTWCETTQVHHLSCVILPDHLDAKDYSGSIVNVFTAYAFLQQAIADGHRGIVATAGNSATGRALLEFARHQNVPVISIVRSATAKGEVEHLGATHVLDTSDPQFEESFAALAGQLKATAVFDGIGGALLTQIMPALPWGSTVYCYGFMGGGGPISIASPLLVTKNLMLKGFSNFAGLIAQDAQKLAAAMTAISSMIDHPAFKTKQGPQFGLDQIGAAMAVEGAAPAILLP
ncbi:MAG TPA: zinc-binding dehydrogenase [Magnetospirillaceae bacterium]